MLGVYSHLKIDSSPLAKHGRSKMQNILSEVMSLQERHNLVFDEEIPQLREILFEALHLIEFNTIFLDEAQLWREYNGKKHRRLATVGQHHCLTRWRKHLLTSDSCMSLISRTIERLSPG